MPSTTSGSTTTVDPKVSATAAVEAAVRTKDAVWKTCLNQMPSCDTAALGVAYAEPWLSESVAQASEWNGNGYATRNNDSITQTIESVSFNEAVDQAVVTVCLTDGGVLFVPGQQGAPEEIVNDTWYSAREAWTVQRGVDGTWKVSSNEVVTDPVVGQENNLCA